MRLSVVDGGAEQFALPMDGKATLQERFEAFHAENPQVYDGLVRLALEARAAGRAKYGIAALVEVLRWSRMTTTGEDFKLNNDYRSRYARLIMENVPELADFFEVREVKAA